MIGKIQKRVVELEKKRAEKGGYKITKELLLIHLAEEVGELAGEFFSQKARKEKFNIGNMKKEICDIILVSFELAHLTDMNLEKELNSKLEELEKRFQLK